MKTWRIPMTREISGFAYIPADSLEEAVNIAQNDCSIVVEPTVNKHNRPWNVFKMTIGAMRIIYNDCQKDEEE